MQLRKEFEEKAIKQYLNSLKQLKNRKLSKIPVDSPRTKKKTKITKIMQEKKKKNSQAMRKK